MRIYVWKTTARAIADQVLNEKATLNNLTAQHEVHKLLVIINKHLEKATFGNITRVREAFRRLSFKFDPAVTSMGPLSPEEAKADNEIESLWPKIRGEYLATLGKTPDTSDTVQEPEEILPGYLAQPAVPDLSWH